VKRRITRESGNLQVEVGVMERVLATPTPSKPVSAAPESQTDLRTSGEQSHHWRPRRAFLVAPGLEVASCPQTAEAKQTHWGVGSYCSHAEGKVRWTCNALDNGLPVL